MMGRVLLVDDESDLLGVVEAVLADEGHEVVALPNGREALEYLAREKPDLVLLDCMMPYVDGIEVLAKIRRTPAIADLPVVMMSAVRPPTPPAGVAWDAFIAKPFSLDALLRIVAENMAAGRRG